MKWSLRQSSLSLALVLLVNAIAVCASEQKAVSADTPAKFADTMTQVRQGMEPGGRYESLNAGERAAVEADLIFMSGLLQQSGSVSAMKQDDRVRLFNAQEHLNGLLTRSDSQRLVCEHRAPVGTHIPLTTCKTVGELDKERRDAQKYGTDSLMIGNKCVNNPQACPGAPNHP